MSENIRGITFAEQTVTPADDAIVRRAILSDGILSGCNITYSGSTLTMAAGYVIACGRIFQITAAQNWAVVDATSGVARLVLTIDLTKTATETAFDQISFSIEYATAENGFVNLTQDDINIAGVRYQVAVAVVSLGAGGITGIISKLEKAEGGGGLNFKVVAGLTQPGSATENTIWVMSEKIGAYYFSAAQPENMQEWDVWFSVGTSSEVSFNALKKNTVQVYPLAAKQYVAGVLVDVTAKSYLDGMWADWWNGEIYDNGNQYESITGGWAVIESGLDVNMSGTSIIVTGGTYGVSADAVVITKKKIDLSEYSKIVVSANNQSYSYNTNRLIVATTNTSVSPDTVASVEIPRTDDDTALDISSLDGSYYIGIDCTSEEANIEITRIKLVR